ncbi:hypothetical protein HanHA89_Chr01g0001771 [Helianthus annuus]|nr:hypothetical protein HanHA89_Chr01g0001771 [Helianthus annuus]
MAVLFCKCLLRLCNPGGVGSNSNIPSTSVFFFNIYLLISGLIAFFFFFFFFFFFVNDL